ncbi:hypothetical protein [Streptomyces sp. cf386]|uniref:hypothetical protein n=1 Tax=Streptomyces sp. cf386 TaxID=1761904 RepID=UPI000B896391|nr:hypothetical protein [Streptomyces sp. cf386]
MIALLSAPVPSHHGRAPRAKRQVRRYLKDRAAAFPDDRAAIFLPIDDPLGPGPPGASEEPEERRLCLLHRLAPPW